MTRTTLRRARLTAGLIAGVVVLAGCSNGSDDSTAAGGSSASSAAGSASASASAEFNDADVAFVQGMLPHHEGALEMAQLAEGRAQDPRVLDLASRIEAAQEPEIETMTGWLQAWGQPESGGMGGMDHGAMGGMDMDMSGLEAASGTEFDRMFLKMMSEHHQQAVDMAKTEISDGENADAIALAEEISTSQAAEIEEMQTILSELGS
ncbi:DUF305 domain-containing protein [Modestobacter sp. SSW1-42]|uniref:DUF305 domain-containing protein n=1 Tax=Modestobacter sp. SSW1-42 TaxID=596372 RepID=UPI0039870D83